MEFLGISVFGNDRSRKSASERYADPQHIVMDEYLTHGQKLLVLEAMLIDEREVEKSRQEDQATGETGHKSGLMTSILAARERLRKELHMGLGSLAGNQIRPETFVRDKNGDIS